MGGYLYNVKFCGKDGTKALICGYAKALEAGKQYCLKYLIPGVDSYNLPNKSLHYTFIKKAGDFNLTYSGCYLPDVPNGKYTIILEEVGVNCEDFIDYVDDEKVTVYDELPPGDEWYMTVVSTDLDGNRIPSVDFRLKNNDTGVSENYSTNSSGHFAQQFPAGNYQIYPVTPDGYEGIVSSIVVVLNYDKYVTMEFRRVEPEDPKCYFEVYVKDTETQRGVSGATVKAESAPGGSFTGVTDSSGYVTLKINCGFKYHITVRKDGYDDFGLFKDATEGSVNVSLPITKESTEPCPAASAYFTIDRYAAGVGEYIDTTGKAHHNDKYQSHKWHWGDGIVTTGPNGQHKYTKTGSYLIKHDVTNECGSTDTVTADKAVVIGEEGAHSLTAPSEVSTNTPFECVIKSDPGRYFVVRDYHFSHDYGNGTTNDSGVAKIKCEVTDPGQYKIYGYSAGVGYAGNFLETNPVDINATTPTPPIPPDPDDPTGGFKLNAPSFAMSEEGFTVKGKHPKPGQKISIKLDKSWAVDPIIGSTYVRSDGSFETECVIDEFSYGEIYAYDPSWLEEWFPDWVPDGWIPGKGLRSNSQRVIVLSWLIIGALVLAVALVLEKKYNKLGIFKKKR